MKKLFWTLITLVIFGAVYASARAELYFARQASSAADSVVYREQLANVKFASALFSVSIIFLAFLIMYGLPKLIRKYRLSGEDG